MNIGTQHTLSSLSADIVTLLEECGTMQRPHSGRVLADHLTGTYALLKEWGNPEQVCLAGLFHSIYGTNLFLHQSLSRETREHLQHLIGLPAENLAWLFCSINRPRAILDGLHVLRKHASGMIRLTGRLDVPSTDELDVTREQLLQLTEIECANLMEQQYWKGALRDVYCAAIEQDVLSRPAMRALRQAYSAALSQSQAKVSA